MSAEDDEYLIKLDSNIEVETIVRNRFEDEDYLSSQSDSSDEDQPETSGESSQADTSVEMKETDTNASGGSEASDNLASAISDVSADSSDSMTIDASPQDEDEEKEASAKEEIPIYRVENQLKDVNCQELIVFCIDMSSDMEKVPFIVTDEFEGKESKDEKESSSEGQADEGSSSKDTKRVQPSALSMVKRAIGMYVHNKHFIDRRHEFGLMILYDTATWVLEFTNNPRKLVETLEDLTETLDCSTCDLSSVVSLLSERYPFIISTDFLAGDMHRLMRVILIYGRSNCMIEFSDPSDKDVLLTYPSLFMDILYVHEPVSDQNKCAEIYEAFCELDDQDKTYIFEMTRSVTKLHNCMGKLLSHPFQRAPQKNANYRLQDILPTKS